MWNKNDINGGKPLSDGFKYSSETNSQWLSIDELKELIEG